MRFLSLEVDGVRSLSDVRVDASPGLNILTGPNGSGKSSFIESLYILSRGRSFRTRKISQVVRRGGDTMFVAAEMRGTGGYGPLRVGMERRGGKSTFRYDGRNIKSSSDLARKVPVALVAPDSHRLLDGGPRFRRRWCDMGVFHMKPEHIEQCRRYGIALRHRNALMRARGCDVHALSAWEKEMSETAVEISLARENYLELIAGEVRDLLGRFNLDDDFVLRLNRGWPETTDLSETLVKYRGRDRQLRYTCSGPHAADIRFVTGGVNASGYLSRGYQKILFVALTLAAAAVMTRKAEPPVVLVDDLMADLDQDNVRRAVEALSELGCQTWVTATASSGVPSGAWSQQRRFHVKQGTIRPV